MKDAEKLSKIYADCTDGLLQQEYDQIYMQMESLARKKKKTLPLPYIISNDLHSLLSSNGFLVKIVDVPRNPDCNCAALDDCNCGSVQETRVSFP